MTPKDTYRMAEEAGWNDGGDHINIEQFAVLVEAAHTDRLLAGVEMPEPDTHCFDTDTNLDVWSHSADQLRETVASAVARKDAEIGTLKAEVERLKFTASRWAGATK